ncbi:hypothetical protein [Leadbettera azotonutricia]|uniref:Uncharacterized protein n=1 Tax=Leadbettera azotonutricia (strain ATCC BAA-888 / DSM 13862 / ZAS-9) TaxID=545695 RepID=F5YDR8_LEAAZ|nr:hypothetical protein [Leadbettera azotonutricia]AEF83360.1 conserved hypothetical protein [Leadbettera azotonutricia ZAS-9]
MFDFITDNIFILIPVAIFVGIRILEARRKQQEAANPKPPPVQIEEEPPPPVKKKKPRKAAAPKAAVPGLAASSAPASPAPDFQRPGVYRTEPLGKPFPENLDYLPPLQRALILSEIFGPPKGLD